MSGWERDEWRAALRGPQPPAPPCRNGHRMAPNRVGGGSCTVCGLTVDREEIS